MLRLKSCPKCKGDLVLDKDHCSWNEQCLQCGYLRDLEGEIEQRSHADDGKEMAHAR